MTTTEILEVADVVYAGDVRRYGAKGNGTTNDDTAIQAAVDAIGAAGGGIVYFPPGRYLKTVATVIDKPGVRLLGAGEFASAILFNPTVAAICFDFIGANAAVTLNFCGILHLGAYSTNTTVKKTWVRVTDISNFTFDRSNVFQPWTSTGFTSIGIEVRGREFFRADKYTLFCDRPVVYSQNPRDGGSNIDADFFTWKNGYMAAASTQPNVYFDPTLRNVYVQVFDGFVFVSGLHGFQWTGAGATADSEGFIARDGRCEQFTAGGWFADFSRTGTGIIYGPQFVNCAPGNGAANSGFKMRNVSNPLFDTIQWSDTVGTRKLFDFDATVSKISWRNVWTQVGCGVTLTGLQLVWGLDRIGSVDNGLPMSAEYDVGTSGALTLASHVWYKGTANKRRLAPTGSIDTYQSDGLTLGAREYSTGRQVFIQGVTVGPEAAGTILSQITVYAPNITPASVAAQVVVEQTFTVTGLTTADKVTVNPPATPNNIGIAGVRVSAADTLAIRFVNPTAGALTPTAGVYTVTAIRS